MKTNTERLYIAFLVVCITIWVLAAKSCTKQKRSALISHYENIINNKDETILYWKDGYNNEHTRAEKLQVDYIVMEAMMRGRELNIKPKRIKSATDIVTRTDTFIQVDTIYKDAWIYIEKKDKGVQLELNDTFKITEYWDRPWFLARKKQYIDIFNTNPYVKVPVIRKYEIKPDRHYLRITGFFGYDFLNRRVCAGVGVTPNWGIKL